jgi:hypothetical protein
MHANASEKLQIEHGALRMGGFAGEYRMYIQRRYTRDCRAWHLFYKSNLNILPAQSRIQSPSSSLLTIIRPIKSSGLEAKVQLRQYKSHYICANNLYDPFSNTAKT